MFNCIICHEISILKNNLIAIVNLPKVSSTVPVLPVPPRNTAFSGLPVPYFFGNTPVPTFQASCPGATFLIKQNCKNQGLPNGKPWPQIITLL